MDTKIAVMNQILILGVGGGSVIKTLVDEIKFKGSITGVEIDPEIINMQIPILN
jgi:spermidine synthase